MCTSERERIIGWMCAGVGAGGWEWELIGWCGSGSVGAQERERMRERKLWELKRECERES
jgi:hypothetical protein